MADLKRYTVFGSEGRLGTLAAPARFLDPRTEKTIQLDTGGEISVSSDKLEVQPDGSFYLQNNSQKVVDKPQAVEVVPAAPSQPSIPEAGGSKQGDKLFRDGYSIEHVKINRLVKDPVSQRQEGETLILPVIEEVYVIEKRIILREEIRITRVRDEVKDAKPLELSSPS